MQDNKYSIYAIQYAKDTETGLPYDERNEKTYLSLKDGVGRFGWSGEYADDLREYERRLEAGEGLTPDEWPLYSNQRFLLDIKEDDYVVYVNIPERGRCTLARVVGGYFWGAEKYKDDDDFRHCFRVDPESVNDFDRHDAAVHPRLRSKLGPRRRWQGVYDVHEHFESLLDSLKKEKDRRPSSPETALNWLKKSVQPSITKEIHIAYVGAELENFIAEIFGRVPGVKNVKKQGGPGEKGADLLVTFEWEIPSLNISEQRKCAVQVKSFAGEISDMGAVDQIRTAFKSWDADMGIIVSTAESSSEEFNNALEKLQEDTEKPVSLLIGNDLAAFVLRYGSELLL